MAIDKPTHNVLADPVRRRENLVKEFVNLDIEFDLKARQPAKLAKCGVAALLIFPLRKNKVVIIADVSTAALIGILRFSHVRPFGNVKELVL